MKIATENEHRVLAYVAAVERHGQILSDGAVEAYAHSPSPATTLTIGRLFQAIASMYPSFTDRFLDLGWLKKKAGGWVQLTPLGQAVLRELDDQERAEDLPVAVVVKPEDPMAYARVIGRIATYDDALLVDPYLEVDSLAIIAAETSTSRILTSREGKGGRARVAALAAALASAVVERAPAIRISEELHDRWVIAGTGPIEHIGESLNGVGKHVSITTVIQDPIATEIRRLHEEMWSRAKPLKPPTAAVRGPKAKMTVVSKPVGPAPEPESATALANNHDGKNGAG